jgi:uncharacterized protein YndB with AHSA1/START domain
MAASGSETEIVAEPGVPQIVITREFEAPRELVFRAHTDPELIAQWLGPRRLQTRFDRFEPRDGGTWRFVQWGEDGYEHGFHGVFHGTPTPDAMVRTFEYEGMPGHVLMETLTLTERDGRTLLRANTVFQSVADRDAMVASGMAEGAHDSMDRLEELLARLAPVS